MPGLMSMPMEIRYQILELCLLVDGTINPYPVFYEDKDQFASCTRRPDVALLRVNKVLNFEATGIFYSKNTWQLNSPRPLGFPTFKKDSMWNLHRDRIFHLRIVMDMRDHSPNTVLQAAKKADERSLNGGQRAIFVHAHCLTLALVLWRWKMWMNTYIKPLTVDVDMKHMYCPTGCCRHNFIEALGRMMREIVYNNTHVYGPYRGQTTCLNVVGLTKGEEHNLICQIWEQDSQVEGDEVPIFAAPRVTIQW